MSFFNLPRRSSSTGPSVGGSRGRDSIYVIRTSHQVDFVHPPRPNALRDTDGWDWVQDAPREDTTCSGIVEVNLARPRRVKCLVVRFITWARLHYPNRIPKTEILFQKKLVLAEGCPEKGMLLEAGKHSFEFLFVVPSTIAESGWTPHGSVQHWMMATLYGSSDSEVSEDPPNMESFKADFAMPPTRGSGSRPSSPSGSPRRSPRSLSPESGSPAAVESLIERARQLVVQGSPVDPEGEWLGRDLQNSRPVFIHAFWTDDGRAVPLYYSTSAYVQDVGIVTWSLETDAITVGGAVNLGWKLQEPSPRATIWQIRLGIVQTISLDEHGEKTHTFAPQTLTLFKKGDMPKNPLNRRINHDRSLWDGEQVENATSQRPVETLALSEIVWLPTEHILRPSTNPGTITPLRLKHYFQLEVFFSTDEPGVVKRASLRKDVLITSCTAINSLLDAPAYDAIDVENLDAYPEDDTKQCACQLPVGDIFSREVARMQMTEGECSSGRKQ